ncbi:cellulase family glycosylhydrolase [Saccharibacillus sp. O23]|uniref:cellulase family glycosylhydrolase n=1 Tax=Saccharibacillus sp. O23 TaxID=2009338 RepID=UPI00269CA49A|nr:cellulase family glycosylhydrolase [Saccharibacillus sp. O23]
MRSKKFRKKAFSLSAVLLTVLLAACAGPGGGGMSAQASQGTENGRASETSKSAALPKALAASSVRTGKAAAASSFVGMHGQLSIKNGKLTDSSGKPVQLKGISSHGIQWYGDYVNKESMKWLRDDWNMNVFRVAMYTGEGGYISNPDLKKKVKEAVDAAIELGVYVIVDWHILSDGDPNTYKTQSKAFFKEMAQTYGDTPNVIYEIANEPNGNVNWNNQIKPYAKEVIAAIRAEDPDNPIIVGTGTWSQDVQDAAASPLDDPNVLYAVHFYAGTHGAWLRERIDAASAKGLAVFVSEWGTSDASGNGGPYLTPSREWTDFLDKRGISWVNWSLADKQEASAALRPGASKNGGWTASELSESGKFVRERMRAGTSGSGGATSPSTVPGQVQGLTAKAGSAKVDLQWTAVSGADSYTVKRALGGGTYSVLKQGVKQAAFTDSTAENGKSYRYKVAAANAKGAGPDSKEVAANPAASGGGTSGSPGTPPSGGSGDLTLLYRILDDNPSDNALRPVFNIRNEGSSPLDLNNVAIRYYYTNEGGVAQNYFCDWAQIGASNVKATFGRTPGAPEGAADYVEIRFSGGTVPAGGESGEIQSRIHKSDWSPYEESGDYSYRAGQLQFGKTDRSVLYVGGKRVSGSEPQS